MGEIDLIQSLNFIYIPTQRSTKLRQNRSQTTMLTNYNKLNNNRKLKQQIKIDLLTTQEKLYPLATETDRDTTNHISTNFETENRLISTQHNHSLLNCSLNSGGHDGHL